MDRTKLPLFAIFKGAASRNIDRQLPSILPADIVGRAQAKAWMDDRTMEIRCNKIYKPNIACNTGNSELLPDDLICDKSDALKQKMDAGNTRLCMIPPDYTG